MPVAILDEIKTKGVLGVLSERFPAIARAKARIRGGGEGERLFGLGFLEGRRGRSASLTSLAPFPGFGGEIPTPIGERRIAGLEFGGGQEIEKVMPPIARRIAGLE